MNFLKQFGYKGLVEFFLFVGSLLVVSLMLLFFSTQYHETSHMTFHLKLGEQIL